MARKKEEFTEREVNLVKELAAHHVTKEAIAGALGISFPTLNQHFFNEIELARHEGKQRIMDMLWFKARTSDRVLIHLADRVLGPVAKLYKDITDLTDEEYLKEGLRRLDDKSDEAIDSGAIREVSEISKESSDPSKGSI